jgi:hypothetical protein
MPLSGRVANIALPHSTRTTIARRRPGRGAGMGEGWQSPPLSPGVHPKLLNMRDFQAGSGFPPGSKTRYNLTLVNPWQTGESTGLGLFPPAWLFMPKLAIGPAKFRAYMLQTHP